MITFIVKIDKEAQIDFGSPYNEARFNDYCRQNIGRKLRIEEEKSKVSDEMRGYYFGAVMPVLRRTCDKWKDLSPIEIHQIIKKMLFYFESYNPITKRTERFARSVMADSDWNNTTKAMYFLERVRQYVEETCGEEWPNAEEYKRFKDSAPLKKLST